MDFYIDHNPFINPVVATNVAPYQPRVLEQRNTERKSLTTQTAFITAEANAVDLFAELKGPFAQTTHLASQATQPVEPTLTLNESLHSSNTNSAVLKPRDQEVDQIAKQRVKLMAAKYASGSQSSEILARLEILNSRLSERSPLVSKEQVTALENANTQLANIRAAREERAKRFCLPAKL